MASRDCTRWLVMLFGDDLTLALTTKSIEDGFDVAGLRYADAGGGTLTASYDRLVDQAGRFVGIRVWPTAGLRFEMLAHSLNYRYVRPDDQGQFFDVYFSGAVLDAESTGEQAFGGQVFRSFTGELALSIDLDYLAQSGRDVLDLKAARSVWVHLE